MSRILTRRRQSAGTSRGIVTVFGSAEKPEEGRHDGRYEVLDRQAICAEGVELARGSTAPMRAGCEEALALDGHSSPHGSRYVRQADGSPNPLYTVQYCISLVIHSIKYFTPNVLMYSYSTVQYIDCRHYSNVLYSGPPRSSPPRQPVRVQYVQV